MLRIANIGMHCGAVLTKGQSIWIMDISKYRVSGIKLIGGAYETFFILDKPEEEN